MYITEVLNSLVNIFGNLKRKIKFFFKLFGWNFYSKRQTTKPWLKQIKTLVIVYKNF